MAAITKSVRELIAFFLMALFAFCLIGCASTLRALRQGSFQAYSGGSLPRDQIAFISRIMANFDSLYIRSIDGQGGPELRDDEFTEFLPGKHVIGVGIFGEEYSTEIVDLKINLTKGRLYQLYRVKYTDHNGWYPAILDITDELAYPEQENTLAAFNGTLKKTGRESLPASSVVTAKGAPPLPGFGEKVKSGFMGKGGRQVKAEYAFDRYVPYICVKADDGLDYHLRISQQDGAVVEVLGTNVYQDTRTAFQSIGSDLAFVSFDSESIGWMPANDSFAVYKETSPGKYMLMKQAYTASFQNIENLTALLDIKAMEGLDQKARMAMILAINADAQMLAKNQNVMDDLKKKYGSGKKEIDSGLKEQARQFAREAVRMADQLATAYQADSPQYEKVQAILQFARQKLKEREDQ